MLGVMIRLDKHDLAQMNLDYFRSLEKEQLVEVANNLHQLAVNQFEKLEINSENSSKPPSTDSPDKGSDSPEKTEDLQENQSEENQSEENQSEEKKKESDSQAKEKRKAGAQPGKSRKWRTSPLIAEETILHHPSHCAACNQPLSEAQISDKPYMGHYVLELETSPSGFRVVCQLHHYYRGTCRCGHLSQEAPGVGHISEIEGRCRDLKLTEYSLVGPMLATFIASLGVRFRMSRAKIQEFLHDWANTELSVGTIDRCIPEAVFACVPVVEELVDQLQQADIIHLDETHWYEKGKLCWLWVAISASIAVFHIGSRRKEELSQLIGQTFIGWLITDGYGAYRSHPNRQRCLAHLIRKAVAITGAINQKAAQIGEWILEDLRELIATIASAGEKSRTVIGDLLARLHRVCHLGKKADHTKLRELAKEILNDWDAVVAFVRHPELPPTNNEAERALRHAVIARQIGFGTRTREGSLAYSSLLSVIETCRLRNLNPWTIICKIIADARKGINPPPIPAV
jgi:transposase